MRTVTRPSADDRAAISPEQESTTGVERLVLVGHAGPHTRMEATVDDHGTGQCPFALDPAGTDIHAEADELRRRGPATRVELPGGVVVWSVNHYSGAKQILKDPLVTKSARDHWPAFINNEIPPGWELISWITMDNMATATGKNQVRLRRLVSKAFSPKRIEALRP